MAYPVKIAASFPTVPTAKFNLVGVRTLMREYHHEMCVLRLRNTPSNNSTFRAGTPVIVHWGLFPRQYQKFVGYVLWAKPHDDREKRTSTVDVLCAGASYPLKEARQRLYTDTTSESVIASIVASMNFDMVYDVSAKMWSSVASPGDTDWKFLVHTAKRRGATLFMRNVTMYCYDPVAYLTNNLAAWPVVKFSDPQGGLTHITKAVADISDDETTSRFRQHRLLTVDPLTLSTINAGENFAGRAYLAPVTKIPTFSHFLKTPSTTTTDAANTVDSLGRVDRFNQRLHITIPGNSRVVAGGGVVVTGYDSESDGLWYVSEVEHETDVEAHPFTYWCHLVLLRDSRSSTGAPDMPSRPARGNVVPRVNDAVLVGRRFISPKAETTVLAYGKVAA